MFIKKITIKNFKAYAEQTQIEFQKKGKNLFLIEGNNRFGKTSLFEAIRWCFYGRLRLDYADKFEDRMQVLKHLGSKEPTLVEIFFEHGDKSYCLQREAEEGAIQQKVKLLTDGVLRSKKQSEIRDMLEKILPERVHPFFLFDAEKVKKVMEVQEDELIKETIDNLVGLSPVTDALYDLDGVKSDIEDEHDRAYRGEARFGDATYELEDAKKILTEQKQLLDQTQEKIKAAEGELKEIDYKLEKENDKRINKLLSEQRQKQAEISNIEIDRARFEEKLAQTLINSPAFILKAELANAEKNAKRMLETAQKKYENEFISGLLEKGTKQGECVVCGGKLQKRAGGKGKVSKVGNIDEIKNLQDIGRYLCYALDQENFESPTGLEDKIKEISPKIKKLKNEMDNIGKILDTEKGHQKAIEILQKRRQECRDKINNLRKKEASASVDLEAIQEDYGKRRETCTRLESKAGKREEIEILKKQQDFAEELIGLLEEFKKRARLSRRDEVLESAWKMFKKLTLGDESYSKFEYMSEENYALQAFTQKGEKVNMETISESEKQMVVLALILGINNYTDYKSPIVIDSPLHRLDTDFRRGFVETLADLQNQVVLLLTHEDFEDVMRIGKDKVTKTYSIKRNYAEYKSVLSE